MCLLLSVMFLGPRAGGFFWWLISPARWELTFSSGLTAFVGLLLLPWTTLMYVAVAPYGVDGFDYVLLGLAVAADAASYSGGGVYGRRRQATATYA